MMTWQTTWPMLAVLAGGGVLGAAFFGGLWWTTRRAVTSRRPAALLVGSFMVRSSAAVAGLALLGWGQWQRIALAMLGFVLARMVLLSALGPDHGQPIGREAT